MHSSVVLFKVQVMSKYFPNVSWNCVTFQVLEPKTIVSRKTPNLPEAFEIQSGKNNSSGLELSSSDLKNFWL